MLPPCSVGSTTRNFASLVNQLLSTVARGQATPALPDITIKINPVRRPGDGGGGGGTPVVYSPDRVVHENNFVNNRLVFPRLFDDLRNAAGDFANWTQHINDARLAATAVSY